MSDHDHQRAAARRIKRRLEQLLRTATANSLSLALIDGRLVLLDQDWQIIERIEEESP